MGPCELIDGRIVATTSAAGEHVRIELRLATRLEDFAAALKLTGRRGSRRRSDSSVQARAASV